MPGTPYALPALAAELVRIPVNVIVTDAMKPTGWPEVGKAAQAKQTGPFPVQA